MNSFDHFTGVRFSNRNTNFLGEPHFTKNAPDHPRGPTGQNDLHTQSVLSSSLVVLTDLGLCPSYILHDLGKSSAPIRLQI